MFDEADQGAIRIKICGICNAEDARAAVALGADAIGLNAFRGSKRFIDIAASASWIETLPEGVRKIAILVDPTFEDALAISRLPFITGLQLHGSESPEFCRRLADRGVAFGKALPVRDESSLQALPDYSTRWLVLDSASAGAFGGSGKVFPWEIARRFIESAPDLKVLLAGGLTPENVAFAIKAVRPFGVDVTSGVEASPGRKDHARLRAFIEAARAV